MLCFIAKSLNHHPLTVRRFGGAKIAKSTKASKKKNLDQTSAVLKTAEVFLSRRPLQI